MFFCLKFDTGAENIFYSLRHTRTVPTVQVYFATQVHLNEMLGQKPTGYPAIIAVSNELSRYIDIISVTVWIARLHDLCKQCYILYLPKGALWLYPTILLYFCCQELLVVKPMSNQWKIIKEKRDSALASEGDLRPEVVEVFIECPREVRRGFLHPWGNNKHGWTK